MRMIFHSSLSLLKKKYFIAKQTVDTQYLGEFPYFKLSKNMKEKKCKNIRMKRICIFYSLVHPCGSDFGEPPASASPKKMVLQLNNKLIS